MEERNPQKSTIDTKLYEIPIEEYKEDKNTELVNGKKNGILYRKIDLQKYIEKMKKIQLKILDFLESENNLEEKHQNLKEIIEDTKILKNRHEFKSLLYLILRISNHHYREINFHSKIEQILQLFQTEMKERFINGELFMIFKSNKRILLFLFENNIITMDQFIMKKILSYKYFSSNYFEYFYPEIKPFINEKWFQKYGKDNWDYIRNYVFEGMKKELPENFFEKRKIGENDDFICSLIQKDLIEEFIIFINKNDYSLNSTIKSSIYETNPFLLNKSRITLIEYSAFFGSIQIFNYLRLNEVELEPSIWIYAIHGSNPEIIYLLEQNYVRSKYNSFIKCLMESIKCHHNYMTNYFMDKINNSNKCIINSIKYYNFSFIQNDDINEDSFYYLCRYNHYLMVDFLLRQNDININKYTISKQF